MFLLLINNVFIISAIYIMCTMGMSALSLLMSLVVLNVHHKFPNKSMSRGMRKVVFRVIGPCVGLNKTSNEYSPKKSQKVSPEDFASQTTISSVISTSDKLKRELNTGWKNESQQEMIKSLFNRLDVLVSKVKVDHEEESRRQEWVAAAKILDRLLLYIFLLVTVLLTIVLLGVYPATKAELSGPIKT